MDDPTNTASTAGDDSQQSNSTYQDDGSCGQATGQSSHHNSYGADGSTACGSDVSSGLGKAGKSLWNAAKDFIHGEYHRSNAYKVVGPSGSLCSCASPVR